MPSSPLGFAGTQQLRALASDLAREGNGGRRFRGRLRRAVVGSTAPIVTEAQQGWRGGYGVLGSELAAATRTRVRLSQRAVGVAVMVDGSKLPAGKQGLPPLVEGRVAWRHPLFGDTGHWYGQDPHPELGPAVARHAPHITAEVITAVEQTVAAIARSGL